MKAHSLFILAILSAALLFAFGCAQKAPEPSVQEPPAQADNTPVAPPQAQPCSGGNVLQKDQCFFELAASKSDSETCKNIYSVEKVDSCYALFANGSLEICKKITDSPMRADCLTENAARAKSEDICNQIGDADRRLACLKNVLPECTLLTDPDSRALCIALEKGDYNYCVGDWCFAEYAKNKSDADACNLIGSPAERFACRAVVKNDVGECKMAPLAAIQDYCIEISSERLDKEEGCSLATRGSDYRNRCYLYFAVGKNRESICAEVEPEFSVGVGTSRNWCYAEFAARTANVSACPKVMESLSQISCYYNAAKKNRMPSLCNPLGTESWRRDCYSNSILYVEGGPVASDCQSVDDSTWKDKCYYKAAYATYNKTMCGFITPGTPDKDSCDALFPDG